MDKIDELYYEGHLKKVEPSPLKSALSIKEAKIWLKEAEETYKNGFYRSSRVSTYFACLHAAQSVTLRDGVTVENPQFLMDYLEKYCEEGNLKKECVEVMNVMFNLHYEDQHHFQSIRNPEDLKQAIEFGHEFINCIKILLGKTGKLPRAMIKSSVKENEFVK
nr:HEPN domain-containing protein [uncultured Methanobacterium sp.]